MRFHQVEEGRLGPVQVLEDDQQGPVPRECFQEAPGGPEDLRGGRPARGAGAERAVKLFGNGRCVRLAVEDGFDAFR